MKILYKCLVCLVFTWFMFSCSSDDNNNIIPSSDPMTPIPTSTNVSFETDDGIKIAATLDKPSDLNSPVPGIIFIHSDGQDKSEWRNLSIHTMLFEKDYILLAYDIRFHGESEKDQDLIGDIGTNPNRGPLDLKAAISFLKADPLVDSNRIAVIGSRLGAEMACVAAGSEELNVKTVIALSPVRSSVIPLSENTPNFQMKSVFFIASELELNGVKALDAQDLFDLTIEPKKIEIVLGSNASGAEITNGNNALMDEMLDWLTANL